MPDNKTEDERREALQLLRMSPYIAAGLFIIGLLLWTIDSAPPIYLLVYGITGATWFPAVVFMWRYWRFTTTILGMLDFALGYTIIDNRFDLPNQTQEVQGTLLALSLLFFLLYILRGMVIRMAKLPVTR